MRKRIVLAGIPENGVVIAKVIQKALSEISALKTELITISLDKRHPREIALSKKLDFDDQVVIIVDDVVNSGKTLLYSVKPFLEFQPRKNSDDGPG
jgi:pyrimidine operon attenuation protein/uracil phosphoribosyltransferase